MESRDVLLKEGCGACDEKSIDDRNLAVEHVFHTFLVKEYEDSWGGGLLLIKKDIFRSAGLTQTECSDIIW